ncbi:unnamed protein product, partial [Mesorhabditis belari]|uniref:Uncharacterized protein n=1 Tax=Mesorhabditis belari TaxID=2138241 RepID=A0AAF3F059_9BILA
MSSSAFLSLIPSRVTTPSSDVVCPIEYLCPKKSGWGKFVAGVTVTALSVGVAYYIYTQYRNQKVSGGDRRHQSVSASDSASTGKPKARGRSESKGSRVPKNRSASPKQQAQRDGEYTPRSISPPINEVKLATPASSVAPPILGPGENPPRPIVPPEIYEETALYENLPLQSKMGASPQKAQKRCTSFCLSLDRNIFFFSMPNARVSMFNKIV